jgi:hypothetical protein
MSELAVGSLKGLAANSFVIDVASGSKIVQPGAVLQVVSTTTGTTTTTTSTSFQNTSATATITPSATSSKILILFQGRIETNNSAGSGVTNLFRGTVSGVALAAGATNYIGSNIGNASPLSLKFLDSPNTISPTTYTVGLRTSNVSNTAVIAGDQNIILLEVAG